MFNVMLFNIGLYSAFISAIFVVMMALLCMLVRLKSKQNGGRAFWLGSGSFFFTMVGLTCMVMSYSWETMLPTLLSVVLTVVYAVCYIIVFGASRTVRAELGQEVR